MFCVFCVFVCLCVCWFVCAFARLCFLRAAFCGVIVCGCMFADLSSCWFLLAEVFVLGLCVSGLCV